MPTMSDGIQSMIAGGSPVPQGGNGFGDDPELIQALQEVLGNMPPEEIAQLQSMPPEELGNFLMNAGVPQEEVGEAIEVLDMLLSQMGGQPVPQMGQGGM